MPGASAAYPGRGGAGGAQPAVRAPSRPTSSAAHSQARGGAGCDGAPTTRGDGFGTAWVATPGPDPTRRGRRAGRRTRLPLCGRVRHDTPGGGSRMFRRTEVAGREPERPTPAGTTAAGNFVVEEQSWPNFSGDLDVLLTRAPVFRSAVRGYDRLQVDNYVAWSEAELRAARRETDDLVERYGRASAELEIARRLLARSPGGQEMSVMSERMGRMLRMAADEAAELTAAGSAEAEQILADARTEADARRRKAHEIKQLAVQTGDRLGEEARLVRAEATAELEQARSEAARLLRNAAAERERLDREAAAARSRAQAELVTWLDGTRAAARREQEEAAAAAEAALAEARGELDELHRRRERACESLVRLDEQIGVALETVADAGGLAAVAGRGNHAAV